MRNASLAVFPLSTGTGQALACGDDGHRIVCEIARRQRLCSNPQADSAPTPSSTRFRNPASIPISCVSAHPSYLMNFSRTGTSLQTDELPDAGTWVLTSILDDIEVLAASSTKRAGRLIALNPLGHWVEDIHQSLYGSLGDDRSVNNIRVIGQRSGNLHIAWDTYLVETAVGSDAAGNSNGSDREQHGRDGHRLNCIRSPRLGERIVRDFGERDHRILFTHGNSCDKPDDAAEISADYLTSNSVAVREQLGRRAAFALARPGVRRQTHSLVNEVWAGGGEGGSVRRSEEHGHRGGRLNEHTGRTAANGGLYSQL